MQVIIKFKGVALRRKPNHQCIDSSSIEYPPGLMRNNNNVCKAFLFTEKFQNIRT